MTFNAGLYTSAILGEVENEAEVYVTSSKLNPGKIIDMLLFLMPIQRFSRQTPLIKYFQLVRPTANIVAVCKTQQEV